MGKTIAQLNGGTVVTSLDGTELVEIEKNGVSVPTTVQAIADKASPGGAAAYLVYAALLTQSGTDDPVATVLQNTLGGTVVWTREAEGFYVGTLTGVFIEDKTALFIANTRALDAGFFITRGNTDTIEIQTGDVDGTSQDSYLDVTSVEIRVYPS